MRICTHCHRQIVGRKQRHVDKVLSLCAACWLSPGRGYQRISRIPFFFQLELFPTLPIFSEEYQEAA